ncbi:MAG: hypothetical protein LBE52_12010 [Providencia sp.]|jgi:hemolysin activation/secretion protein|nr:hypothetical protein [Providencia sp.]
MKTKPINPSIFLIVYLAALIAVMPKGFAVENQQNMDTNQLTTQPCIIINVFKLMGMERLPKIKPKQIKTWRGMIEGQCMTQPELLTYADYINTELIQAGYLTSYLSYPAQALFFGSLQAEVITGTISNIHYQGVTNTLPFEIGDVLNLRHIEQGLYNLQNAALVPYRIELMSDGLEPQATEIIVVGGNRRDQRGELSIESYPFDEKTKTVISHDAIFANPLQINDLLYLKINHSLGSSKRNKRQAIALGYSAPYRYWLLSIYSHYQNSQAELLINDIALDVQQRQRALLLTSQYILNRAENSVTSFSISSQIQTLDTFLAGQRLMTQRRLASYLSGEFVYQQVFSQGQATVSLGYKQGNSWFGANAAQITGLERPQIYQLSFSSAWGSSPVYYQNSLDIQLSRSQLDGLLERNAFFGKGGVQGFSNSDDIEMGDNSLKLHNEVSWDMPWKFIQLYSSIGMGVTANDRATFWRKNALLGCKAGVRGAIGAINYHAFIEMPVWQANQVVANNLHSGFQASMSY